MNAYYTARSNQSRTLVCAEFRTKEFWKHMPTGLPREVSTVDPNFRFWKDSFLLLAMRNDGLRAWTSQVWLDLVPRATIHPTNPYCSSFFRKCEAWSIAPALPHSRISKCGYGNLWIINRKEKHSLGSPESAVRWPLLQFWNNRDLGGKLRRTGKLFFRAKPMIQPSRRVAAMTLTSSGPAKPKQHAGQVSLSPSPPAW